MLRKSFYAVAFCITGIVSSVAASESEPAGVAQIRENLQLRVRASDEQKQAELDSQKAQAYLPKISPITNRGTFNNVVAFILEKDEIASSREGLKAIFDGIIADDFDENNLTLFSWCELKKSITEKMEQPADPVCEAFWQSKAGEGWADLPVLILLGV